MNMTQHFDQEDLALFAMQLLSNEEAAVIAQHVDRCADCHQELAAIQGDLAVYAHTVDLHSPPALARERLLKQVAREKKIVPVDRSASAQRPVYSETTLFQPTIFDEEDLPQKSFAARALPWAGWAIAAGFALTAGQLYREREALRTTVGTQATQMASLTADAAAARQLMDTLNDASAMRVTLNKSQTTPVPQGRVTYVPDKGSLVFIASNMEPLQPYKVYELWLIPADGRDPIAAGTFKPDDHGNASIVMPSLPKGVEAKAFGITIEDNGGSQTPTLPIVMVGA